MPSPIDDALRELEEHSAVRSKPHVQEREGRHIVTFDVEVSLPSRAKDGVSATGVWSVEPVWLVFHPEYPLKAPSPRLRADFPSNLAHINPHRRGDPVPPCIFEGDLSELMHRFGLVKVLDQLLLWLKKAAEGQLLDLDQGWEPTRRGSPEASFEFDADAMALSLGPKGDLLKLPSKLFQVSQSRHFTLGHVGADAGHFNVQARSDTTWWGTAPVLVACAPWQDGKPAVFGDYAADTVTDLASLVERARSLGISIDLAKALESEIFSSLFQSPGAQWPWPGDFCLGVILAAHRPVHLIGSHRDVEFVPYLLRIPKRAGPPQLADAVIEPAYQLHTVSPRLLAATSGYAHADLAQMVTILGCGSLGSKVSVHLGRAGFGNQTLVDEESLSPHNLARHALLTGVALNKAEQTKWALVGLGHQNVRAVARDVVPGLVNADPGELAALLPPQTKLVLETTGSLKVASALSRSQHLGSEHLRVARAFLIGGGRAAVLLLESRQRAVRIDDLYAHLFARCRADPQLRQVVGGESGEPAEVFVGDNCRSLTLRMPDSIVSRGASVISTQLQRWLADGFPAGGQIRADATGEGGGSSWHAVDLGATQVLRAKGDGGWTVRVNADVAAALTQESNHWLPCETGGALLGHVDLLSRTIYIADLVAAPQDSVRAPEQFVLGTLGLRDALKQAHSDSVGYLHYVGTWHSHPMGGAHSQTDFDTLRRLASFAPGLPVVSLVWTSGGLVCEVGRFNAV